MKMKIKSDKIVNDINYLKYNVSMNGKKDVLCWSSEVNVFEPYNGNFDSEEMREIKKKLKVEVSNLEYSKLSSDDKLRRLGFNF
jgi:hypothetical protein